jgi:hypothetical protein
MASRSPFPAELCKGVFPFYNETVEFQINRDMKRGREEIKTEI